MDLSQPPPNFTHVLFERTNPEANEYRFYYIAWLPTLTGQAMVRIWGRRGQSQHEKINEFASLEAAWPAIRGHIRKRLAHGYRVAEPVGGGGGPDFL